MFCGEKHGKTWKNTLLFFGDLRKDCDKSQENLGRSETHLIFLYSMKIYGKKSLDLVIFQ
jgi:hypothetical protein